MRSLYTPMFDQAFAAITEDWMARSGVVPKPVVRANTCEGRYLTDYHCGT